MPVMLVHGDMATAVPVSLARTWADAMKSLKMSLQADIFAFVTANSR